MSLDDSERDELVRLRQEVSTLSATNDALVSSVHTLSGELMKRRHSVSVIPVALSAKRTKYCDSPPLILCSSPKLNGSLSNLKTEQIGDVGLPNEIMLHMFKFLSRDSLDRCSLVCRRWKKIIDAHENKLARRSIRLFKVIETPSGAVTFSAATAANNRKYHLSLEDEQSRLDIVTKVSRMLSYSKVRRCLMCGFHLTELMVHDLVTIFKRANVKFYRLEMIGISLKNLSAETFQKFVGERINAEQYFLDGLRDADGDHFNHKLFERPSIARAEDITVYDVSSVNAEEIILEVGDDVLLDFIFGKNTSATDRSSIYLDSPSVSPSFVFHALLRFVQEPCLKSSIPHAEFAHCREQTMHANRCIVNEYDTDVQSEYSAKNSTTNHVLEAKITRQEDESGFVHITFTITPINQ